MVGASLFPEISPISEVSSHVNVFHGFEDALRQGLNWATLQQEVLRRAKDGPDVASVLDALGPVAQKLVVDSLNVVTKPKVKASIGDKNPLTDRTNGISPTDSREESKVTLGEIAIPRSDVLKTSQSRETGGTGTLAENESSEIVKTEGRVSYLERLGPLNKLSDANKPEHVAQYSHRGVEQAAAPRRLITLLNPELAAHISGRIGALIQSNSKNQTQIDPEPPVLDLSEGPPNSINLFNLGPLSASPRQRQTVFSSIPA